MQDRVSWMAEKKTKKSVCISVFGSISLLSAYLQKQPIQTQAAQQGLQKDKRQSSSVSTGLNMSSSSNLLSLFSNKVYTTLTACCDHS